MWNRQRREQGPGVSDTALGGSTTWMMQGRELARHTVSAAVAMTRLFTLGFCRNILMAIRGKSAAAAKTECGDADE